MTYRFGVFEFDPLSGGLRKNGRGVALEPQPAKVLALLLSRSGDVVTRDALRDAVWGSGTHVDFDRGLAYCVSQIRSALGDSGDNPRFVQTLPKRGYKFIAPVTSDAAPDTIRDARVTGATGTDVPTLRSRLPLILIAAVIAIALGWAASRMAAPASGRIVVAVSIFDNESGVPEHDRLVAGLSDLVVTRLTELEPSRLAVVGNAAVLRQPRNIRNLKAVAEGVKADYVVLGQLQRGEAGLRFITHLIRLRDEAHLKANRLQMSDGQIAGIEGAVVAEFERAVREHILAAGR